MDVYSEHLIRDGFGADVAKASEAWKAGASNVAPAAVSQALLSALSDASGIEGEIDRLRAQDEARVDLHCVEIDAGAPREFEKMVAKLSLKELGVNNTGRA